MTIQATGAEVQVQPCVEHLKRKAGEPACFQNWGGAYQIVRPLRWGMVLLEHVASSHLGLVKSDEIIPMTEEGGDGR